MVYSSNQLNAVSFPSCTVFPVYVKMTFLLLLDVKLVCICDR